MTVQGIIATVCMLIGFYLILYFNGYYDYMTKKGIEHAKKRKQRKNERRF